MGAAEFKDAEFVEAQVKAHPTGERGAEDGRQSRCPSTSPPSSGKFGDRGMQRWGGGRDPLPRNLSSSWMSCWPYTPPSCSVCSTSGICPHNYPKICPPLLPPTPSSVSSSSYLFITNALFSPSSQVQAATIFCLQLLPMAPPASNFTLSRSILLLLVN